MFTSLVLALTALGAGPKEAAVSPRQVLIAGIDREILWHGRSGRDPTWFHPRPCLVPAEPKPHVLMTLQLITGSDIFHQVHWTLSEDGGKTWRKPEPIEALGRVRQPDGVDNGVCDIVPEFHRRTNTVLAMGHNVYYKDGRLYSPSEGRYPVYSVRDAAGKWSERRKLEWDDPRGSAIYTCGCGQRLTLGNGDILVPLSFGPKGRRDRAVGTALCSFDGATVTVKAATEKELRLPVQRGLLEPSIARFGKRFFLTIRAEDGRGYVAASDDGLTWPTKKPWCWDDGTPLTMSTTQQHWVAHSGGLFLTYTRKAKHNANVFRWRAPLYIARVDPERLCLVRASERVVLPLIGDGIQDAKHVARMGNFHIVNASPSETWLTVGETLPDDGWRGDTLLARIRWATPNTLVPR